MDNNVHSSVAYGRAERHNNREEDKVRLAALRLIKIITMKATIECGIPQIPSMLIILFCKMNYKTHY